MNGELAQLAALAAHGSVWLAGAESPPPDLRRNSTWRYVRSTMFVGERHLDRAGGSAAWGSAGDWLLAQRWAGAARLWLTTKVLEERRGELAPHLACAFPNGGRWALLADVDRRQELWTPSWDIGDPGGPDQRIWDVVYRAGRVGHVFRADPSRPDPSEARHELLRELRRARDFAFSNGYRRWALRFERAIKVADADRPAIAFHPDLLPERGYGLLARQLAASAALAWVFGAMGSWNDLWFADPEVFGEHAAISAALYTAVLRAWVAAVNSEIGPADDGS